MCAVYVFEGEWGQLLLAYALISMSKSDSSARKLFNGDESE